MRISAVIPAYNYGHFLDRSVVSALVQSEPCEVIVVDDGSRDATPAVMARLQAMFAGSALRYLRTQNAGPSAARNAGVRAATGDWIAFLDADDAWYPGKLAAQRQFAARHPGGGLLFAGVDYEDVDGYRRRRLPPREGTVTRAELLRENLVPSPTALVNRAVFDAAGGFDEGRSHGEDWDLWLRIAMRARVLAQRAVLAMYFDHAAGLHRHSTMANGSREVLAAALARAPTSALESFRARAALDTDKAIALAVDGRWTSAWPVALRALAHDPSRAARLALGFAGAALRGALP